MSRDPQLKTEHFVLITTNGMFDVWHDKQTGQIKRRPTTTPTYGWECLSCNRAERSHYRLKEQAQAQADAHARPLTVNEPLLVEQHAAFVVQSQQYRVMQLDDADPVVGLGYGWECIFCDRAEAAVHATEEEARRAADQHQRARTFDLLTVNQFIDKIEQINKDVFGILDRDTHEARAFVLKAGPVVNEIVQRITGVIPPRPHGANNN
jgi:hypothetical protein